VSRHVEVANLFFARCKSVDGMAAWAWWIRYADSCSHARRLLMECAVDIGYEEGPSVNRHIDAGVTKPAAIAVLR
jgi:hypothetical protein